MCVTCTNGWTVGRPSGVAVTSWLRRVPNKISPKPFRDILPTQISRRPCRRLVQVTLTRLVQVAAVDIPRICSDLGLPFGAAQWAEYVATVPKPEQAKRPRLESPSVGSLQMVVAEERPPTSAASSDPMTALVSANPKAAKYADATRTELVKMLLRRDATIARMKNSNTAQKRKQQRQQAKSEALVLADHTGRPSSAIEQQLVVHHKAGCPLSSRSILALGVRRNLSNVASKDLPMLSLHLNWCAARFGPRDV